MGPLVHHSQPEPAPGLSDADAERIAAAIGAAQNESIAVPSLDLACTGSR